MTNPPTYSESTLEPLSTDDLIHKRVTALIGRAVTRQLWLLLLDGEDVQNQHLMPFENLPARPNPEEIALAGRTLRFLVDEMNASSLILVWERYQDASLTTSDRAWARHLHDACDSGGVRLRAMLLSHRGGVRWIAQDDYRFESPPAQ